MAQARVGIILEAEDRATATLKNVQGQLSGFSNKIQAMAPQFRAMALAGGAAFAALSVGVMKTISVARDFTEETNKFNVVFKDVSKSATAMAETLNESYGLSRLASQKLLSSTGDILTGFGFAGKGALDLSSRVATLAVDLASFTNAAGGAEAVASALTKGLLGERESLKTYGIAIQEADVKAELLAQGLDQLTGEALRQARAMVTLDIAYRQSKNAIGDYARSAGTLTQTQVELRKNIEDLNIAIGLSLQPILNSVLKRILPVVKIMAKWAEDNPRLTKTILLGGLALTGLVATIGIVGLALPSLIKGFLAAKAAALALSAGMVFLAANPIGWAIIAIGALVTAGVLLYKHWDTVVEKLRALGNVFKEIFNAIKNVVLDTVKIISDAFELGAIGRFIGKMAGKGISVFNRIVGPIPQPEKISNTIVEPAPQPEKISNATVNNQNKNENNFNFNFNGDVSDIETLKKTITNMFNRDAILRSISGT